MMATINRHAMDPRIAYIDLYAGPGRYRDGSASTPLLILEKAISNPNLAKMLVAVFNDANQNYSDTLQGEIRKLAKIDALSHYPVIYSSDVGSDFEQMFETTRLIPSFSFIDPFGYKGLSLKIVNGVIKDWGCDCVFFFNYNRINAGLANLAVDRHMKALFGDERVEMLRAQLLGLSPSNRESLILEELSQSIRSMGGRYVLPFRFKRENRTSHYLIFISKHVRGYEIMKEIMAKESSCQDQGVATFAYSPAEARFQLLFSLNRPFDSLLDDLALAFSGKKLTMKDVYDRHHVDTPYIKANYKKALGVLESNGRIIVDPPLGSKGRRNGTFADSLLVTFP